MTPVEEVLVGFAGSVLLVMLLFFVTGGRNDQ